MSALVPIVDPATGMTVAVFGLDYPASFWAAETNKHIYHALALVSCILLLTLLLYGLARKNAALSSVRNRLMSRESLFRTVFEQAPIGIAIGRNDKLVSDINPLFEKMLGRTREELTSISWADYTHPDDVQMDLENFARFKAGNTDGYAMEKRYVRPDGSFVWVNMTVAPLRLPKDDTVSANHLCLIEDITDRVNAVQALRESGRSQSVFLANLPGMAYRCLFDRDWTMLFVSDGCLALTGYEPSSLLHNRDLSYNDLIALEYRENLWREWVRVSALKEPFQFEYQIKTADGKRKWVSDFGQGIYDENGDVEALEGIIIDISEQKNRDEQIRHMIDHDALTGLYNRKYMDEETARLNAAHLLPISVIIVDINGLRLINDAFGHLEGDRLIKSVAELLKSCCRRGDVLSRMGGDEFSILLPNTDSETAHELSIKIKSASADYKNASNLTYDIDLCVAYATKQTHEGGIEQTIKEAELFLHNRKLLDRRSSYSAIVSSMMATVFEKSQETEAHAQRIASLCQMIGERLHLADRSLGELQLFAMLHDIGKVAVHDEILNKQEPLTKEEWDILKKHPVVGYRIALSSPDLAPLAEYILYHHERWDGKGYPQGLVGEEIPLLSRILAVADAYDAMTENRSYRKAMSRQAALKEIEVNAGLQFDPGITQIFLDIM